MGGLWYASCSTRQEDARDKMREMRDSRGVCDVPVTNGGGGEWVMGCGVYGNADNAENAMTRSPSVAQNASWFQSIRNRKSLRCLGGAKG